MERFHRAHESLQGEHHVEVELIGCGGSGSQMLTGLARLNAALRALGGSGFHVTAFDPDEVTSANVARQLFSAGDVGQNKAVVLVNRINAWFGLRWNADPRASRNAGGTIVISCVDSRAARRQIERTITRRTAYWMDLGNREQDGQVVLGTPGGRSGDYAKIGPDGAQLWLPTVMDLFGAEMNGKDTAADRAPSCSLAEALERQHLFVNQAVVTPAVQILWQLFRFGKITWHGAFVNLATGHVRPLPVDPQAWARIRGDNPAANRQDAKAAKKTRRSR